MASALVLMTKISADGVVIFLSSPWVILNDFGGAFSMGAVGGGIWYGIKGARNSPRVRCSIDLISRLVHTSLPGQYSGRTSRWRSLLNKSPCARNRWELRCVGWNVLYI